jgi:hypothetical protein
LKGTLDVISKAIEVDALGPKKPNNQAFVGDNCAESCDKFVNVSTDKCFLLEQAEYPGIKCPFWCGVCSKTLPAHKRQNSKNMRQHCAGARHLKLKRQQGLADHEKAEKEIDKCLTEQSLQLAVHPPILLCNGYWSHLDTNAIGVAALYPYSMRAFIELRGKLPSLVMCYQTMPDGSFMLMATPSVDVACNRHGPTAAPKKTKTRALNNKFFFF